MPSRSSMSGLCWSGVLLLQRCLGVVEISFFLRQIWVSIFPTHFLELQKLFLSFILKTTFVLVEFDLKEGVLPTHLCTSLHTRAQDI